MPTRSKQPSKTKDRSLRAARPGARAVPSEDEVRALAYHLFQARGGEPGHELEDWLQAERELRGAAE